MLRRGADLLWDRFCAVVVVERSVNCRRVDGQVFMHLQRFIHGGSGTGAPMSGSIADSMATGDP